MEEDEENEVDEICHEQSLVDHHKRISDLPEMPNLIKRVLLERVFVLRAQVFNRSMKFGESTEGLEEADGFLDKYPSLREVMEVERFGHLSKGGKRFMQEVMVTTEGSTVEAFGRSG